MNVPENRVAVGQKCGCWLLKAIGRVLGERKMLCRYWFATTTYRFFPHKRFWRAYGERAMRRARSKQKNNGLEK